MLARAAAILESNLARVAEEWLSIRPAGEAREPAPDVAASAQALLEALVRAMREQSPAVSPDLEQQAEALGRRYREQGYELPSLAAEYTRLRELLWQLYRQHLRAGDLSVVELAEYLEDAVHHMLLAAVLGYWEAHATALAEQAAVDPLTGLYHRGYLLERLAAEIDRGERYQHPFTILMVDLDGLKTINDTLGHQAGDEALRRVAAILRTVFRKADLVGRYGGDEFLVILPETGAEGAFPVARRLATEVVEACIPTARDHQQLSVSVGVAAYPEGGTRVESLVEAADRLLYEAKARGGNTVVIRWPDGNLEVVQPARPAAAPAPAPEPAAPGVELEAPDEGGDMVPRLARLEAAVAEIGRGLERLQERLLQG